MSRGTQENGPSEFFFWGGGGRGRGGDVCLTDVQEGIGLVLHVCVCSSDSKAVLTYRID